MNPDLDAACEAARTCVQRYREALEQTRVTRTASWGNRLDAANLLWSVLEDADALLQDFPEDAPRGEREALITLAEYWHEIEPLDVYERMEADVPKAPSLQLRAVVAYRRTTERMRA